MKIYPEQPSLEEALAHFGIKGMRWGVRSGPKTGPGGKPLPTRKELRGMNKAAKAKQKADLKKELDKDDAEIIAARGRVEKSYANIAAAKKKYKNDKRMLGKITAREILNKTTQKDYETISRASDMTQKEAKRSVLTSVGIIAASVATGAAIDASTGLKGL